MSQDAQTLLAITLIGWVFLAGGAFFSLRSLGSDLKTLRTEVKTEQAECTRRVDAALTKLDELRRLQETRHRRALVWMATAAGVSNPHGEQLLRMVHQMSEDSDLEVR